MERTDLTGKALKTLLTEVFQGGQEGWSWFLNPGDPGLARLLRSVSADEASRRPGDSRKTVAAHTAHLVYHLELINKVLAGDQQAFANSDWSTSWKRESVTAAEWEALIGQLELLSIAWIAASENVKNDDEVMLTGSLASPVHFAYHLGSIRQILLTVREPKGAA